MLTPLSAMVRKDLKLFFSDRRAVIMSFAVPIAIASFFGSVFSGPTDRTQTVRVPVAIVDQDGGPIAAKILSNAQSDTHLAITTITADAARAAVRRGTITVGVIVPPGFGAAAARAFFAGGSKPTLELFYDPSHAMEMAMVRGILAEHVMQAVSQEVFSGSGGRAIVDDALAHLDRTGLAPAQQSRLGDMLRSVQKYYSEQDSGPSGAAPPGLAMPYAVHEEPVTAGPKVAYNGYAHAFAGMGIQFLLFAAANLGVEVLLERQRGLWKRLRSAPVSRRMLLVGKTASGAIIALTTLFVSFAFAMVVFGVRIQGSVVGFLAVAIACALMAATFGLLIAAVGKTPAATRGVTTFAILIMVMLGGAWVPTFIFPAWLQRLTVVVPARWAVDGLDAMTWRGIGVSGAVMPTLVLLGFAALFWSVAANRFRWEE
jgi:ABC-2 type transport system permease protein